MYTHTDMYIYTYVEWILVFCWLSTCAQQRHVSDMYNVCLFDTGVVAWLKQVLTRACMGTIQERTQKKFVGFPVIYKSQSRGSWGGKPPPPRCCRVYSFSDSFHCHFLCFVTQFIWLLRQGIYAACIGITVFCVAAMTGVPRVVNSKKTNSVTS